MFPLKDNIPTELTPVVNYLLIAICTLVFMLELSQGSTGLEQFIDTYGLVPSNLLHSVSIPELSTVFSSMFLHAGWEHLLGNMWFLFIFGDNVEDRFGHVGYLFFYLFCGICAAATQVMINPDSSIAMIGASGAISGVLGYYFVTYPQAQVLTLVPLGGFSRVTEVPAIIFLGIWFAMQFFTGIWSLVGASQNEGGGVAFWAHVGGFVAGVVLAFVLPKQRQFGQYSNYNDYNEWR
jgi:membrane associated rhomboid family serine protease